MITAELYTADNMISGFKISGHAGYDDMGKDIVCASVSSAVQYTANLITEIFGYNADVSAHNNAVILKAVPFDDSILQKLFKGLIMHLELLSEDFKGTIKIKYTEV